MSNANECEGGGDRRRLERLRWHCRRGMLELDLVLQRFVERHLSSLAQQDLDLFEQLLELSDNDLFDVTMGRAEMGDEYAHLVRLMRQS